jgi:hypothetical protein
MTKPNSLMINKFLSIITEGEGNREGEGLPNYCRWKSSGRHGPHGGGGAGGGGAWSRWWFSGAAVKAGRTARFLSTAVKVEQTAWLPCASTWRRSKASAWKRMRRRAPGGGGRGGGFMVGK